MDHDLAPQENNQLWQYLIREKARKSLYLCAKNLLKKKVSPSQQELCEFVSGTKKKSMALWPRGHGKTTLSTESFIIYILINNPESRILIRSATSELAVDILRTIKDYFLNNTRFRFAFPEFVPSNLNDFGTQNAFDVANKLQVTKEHSVESAGLETNKTGHHYDWIIYDDVVTRENSATKELCEKTIHCYEMDRALFDVGGRELVVGTRYSYADVYGRIIDAGDHELNIKGCFREDGSPLCPEFFTAEELMSRKKTMSPYIWSCQYENNPIDPATALFKTDRIKSFKRDELTIPLNIFTMVDPAISEKDTADYSAIVTAGVDKDWNIYVLDVSRRRVLPDALIEEIFQINERFKPLLVGVETVQFQKALEFFLRQRAKERNLHIPIRELKRDTRETKYQRIAGLSPKVEFGEVFIEETCRNREALIDEMRRYPKTAHDDCVDALADILRLGYRAEVAQTLERIKPNSGAFWDKVLDNLDNFNNSECLGNESVKSGSTVNWTEVMYAA